MKKFLNRAQIAFVNALFQLMAEKPFDQISISELSDRAQYDRRTFYRYFQSKKDVLYLHCVSLLQEMTKELKKEMLTPRFGFLAYFEFWNQHRDFLTLLDRQGLLYFLGENQDQLLYQNVGTAIQGDLPKQLGEVSEFSQYAYYFTLGGLWQTLILWIHTGMKLTPERLTQHILDVFTEMQKLIL